MSTKNPSLVAFVVLSNSQHSADLFSLGFFLVSATIDAMEIDDPPTQSATNISSDRSV